MFRQWGSGNPVPPYDYPCVVVIPPEGKSGASFYCTILEFNNKTLLDLHTNKAETGTEHNAQHCVAVLRRCASPSQ